MQYAGAAYIYERASTGTWNLAERLKGTSAGGHFGYAVAISNVHVIIGAIGEDNFDGAVYIYRRNVNGV